MAGNHGGASRALFVSEHLLSAFIFSTPFPPFYLSHVQTSAPDADPAASCWYAAQPIAPANPGKLKVKTKPDRTTAVAPPGAPAPPTDWSLPYAATITPEGLKANLTVLASEAYEGRETSKKGQEMAAKYIAKAFAADGLTGHVTESDNLYVQHFEMSRTWLDMAASTIKVGSKTYLGVKNFYALLGKTFNQPVTLRPVFIGYGIKKGKYSDFPAGADFKDKDIRLVPALAHLP